jgi:hypothetical protein
MLSHMYVVQSADARANLSSIEIIWCLGKNCMSVGTVHIIDPWVSIRRSLSMIDPHAVSHVCCAECRRWINSLLHWNHMVFGPELIKRRYCSYHRSLSIETPFVEYDRSTCPLMDQLWHLSRLPNLLKLSRLPNLLKFSVVLGWLLCTVESNKLRARYSNSEQRWTVAHTVLRVLRVSRVIRVAITTRSKNSRTVDRQSIDPGMTIRWRLVHKGQQSLSLEISCICVQYSSSCEFKWSTLILQWVT